MAEINPKDFENIKKSETGIERKNVNGFTYYKGPWLESWFDDYTECLKKNQAELRIQQHKKLGLNEQGQTPEQEKAFKARQMESKKRKEKALLASEMAAQNA